MKTNCLFNHFSTWVDDGVVTAEEIKTVMQSIGQKMSIEEAQEMVDKGDTNGDGVLDYKGKAHITRLFSLTHMLISYNIMNEYVCFLPDTLMSVVIFRIR